MKKLFTLLLVLVGYVGTVSAWGDLYLICNENSSWSNTSYTDAFKFTCIAENQYRATVPGSYITSGDWYFRFRDKSSDSWQNISPESTENDQEITSTTYSTNWQNSSSKAFYISKNTSAKYVHIYCTWNTSTSKWDITCSVVTSTTDYNVAYTNPSGWSDVYVYAFLDGVTLTNAWPGTKLSLDNGVYKSTITGAANSRIIFNKGESGDGNQSWTMDLVNDAVYNYDGVVANQTVSVNATYGMSTFCSQYPLDFSTASPSDLKAYRIYESSTNGLLYISEVNKVPAGVGVYLEGSGDYTVSPTATATSIGDNMLVGVTSETAIAQIDGDYTNFILTTNKGASATPKFYKVNTAGNTVAAGKAYLQIPTANVGARQFFWFEEEETTGVEALKPETMTDGQAYNLAGQRVAQPTKGLYIVNGKKYMVK